MKIFNLLKYFFFCFFLVLLTSCSSKDSVEPSKTEQLKSTIWLVESIDGESNANGTITSVLIYKKGVANSIDYSKARFTFNADETFIWVLPNSQGTFNTLQGKWQLLNNDTQMKITSSADNSTIIIPIKQLTKTNFNFSMSAPLQNQILTTIFQLVPLK